MSAEGVIFENLSWPISGSWGSRSFCSFIYLSVNAVSSRDL